MKKSRIAGMKGQSEKRIERLPKRSITHASQGETIFLGGRVERPVDEAQEKKSRRKKDRKRLNKVKPGRSGPLREQV